MAERASGERLVEAVLRRRWAWLAALALVTLGLGLAAARVGVDNAVEVWFVDDDPALVAWRDFQATFGNDEVVAIGLFGDSRAAGGGPEAGMLDAPGLERVRRVERAAAGTEGIAETRSVLSAPTVRGAPGLLEVGPVVDEEAGPVDDEAAALVREAVGEDDTLGMLVGEDVAVVSARMAAMDDIDARRDGILEKLRAAVATEDPDAAFAGIGVVYAALNRASTRDSAIFILGSYLLIALLLWRLLGRAGALALVLGVVGVGSVWVLGFQGLAGRDINMVTMVLPTLVLVIGTSDCVHMLSRVAELDPAMPRWDRVRRGVGLVVWPCLFNTLTTAAGFLALTTSQMRVVRDLGLFSALGLLAAFVVALVGCSVGLLWPRLEARPVPPEGDRLQRAVEAVAGLAVERWKAVLLGAAALGLVAALGVTRLVADTWSIAFLHADDPVRVDSDRLEASYGPYTPLEFVVERDAGVRDPALLAALARWQDRVEAELPCRVGEPLAPQVPCVGWSRSAADVVRRLHRVMGGEGAMPADAAALEQLLFLYESDPDSDLDELIGAGDTRARVTFGVPMASARGFAATIEAVAARAELPPDARLRPAGYLPLYVRMMDYIVASQLSSFSLAFVVIFGLIALLFRSARTAALAVPANLLPVLFTLGLMGIAGIRLDVATVTISAIVLGLVVDDTVQFLYRYRQEAARFDTVPEAVRAAVHGVGRPMAVTTIVLAVGFLVLGLAAVKSVAFFGLLLAVALGSALLADLMVVPALIVALDWRGGTGAR